MRSLARSRPFSNHSRPYLVRAFARALAASLFVLALGASTLSAEASAGATAKAGDPTASYRAGFEAAGFHVFPSPVDIGEVGLEALSPGGIASLSALRGKVVLLNFWATWCPPCRSEMPSIDALWKRLKDKPFSVVAVSVGESRSVVEKFIKTEKYGFPVFLDPKSELGSAFNARSIPTTYILDKEGRVIAGAVGARDYGDARLVGLIESLATR